MKARRSMLLAAVFSLMFLAGCLDSIPLDEYGYVLSIGVDKGQTKTYNVSFLLQQEGDSQESQAGAGAIVVAAEGDNIFEAVSIAHMGVPYKLNFTRANYLVFSRDVAQSELLARFLSSSFDEIGLRRSTKLLIVLGDCNEYFNGLNSPSNPSVAKRQYSLFQNYGNEGLIPMTSLSAYREAVGEQRFDVMTALGTVDTSIEQQKPSGEQSGGGGQAGEEENMGPGTTGGVKREGGFRSYTYGCAVFNGDMLAAVFNGSDTEMLLMATGKFREGRISYANDRGEYSFLLAAAQPPEITVIAGDIPTAEVYIRLSARKELDTANDFAAVWDDTLKPALEEYIEAQLLRVFLLCRSVNSDAMGFGKRMSTCFANAEQWYDYDWKEKYALLEADFNVSITSEELKTLEVME